MEGRKNEFGTQNYLYSQIEKRIIKEVLMSEEQGRKKQKPGRETFLEMCGRNNNKTCFQAEALDASNMLSC